MVVNLLFVVILCFFWLFCVFLWLFCVLLRWFVTLCVYFVSLCCCVRCPMMLIPISHPPTLSLFLCQDGVAIWRQRQDAGLRGPGDQRCHRWARVNGRPAGWHPRTTLVQPHAHRLGVHLHGRGQHGLRRRDRGPVNTRADRSMITVHVAWNTHYKYMHYRTHKHILTWRTHPHICVLEHWADHNSLTHTLTTVCGKCILIVCKKSKISKKIFKTDLKEEDKESPRSPACFLTMCVQTVVS